MLENLSTEFLQNVEHIKLLEKRLNEDFINRENKIKLFSKQFTYNL